MEATHWKDYAPRGDDANETPADGTGRVCGAGVTQVSSDGGMSRIRSRVS